MPEFKPNQFTPQPRSFHVIQNEKTCATCEGCVFERTCTIIEPTQRKKVWASGFICSHRKIVCGWCGFEVCRCEKPQPAPEWMKGQEPSDEAYTHILSKTHPRAYKYIQDLQARLTALDIVSPCKQDFINLKAQIQAKDVEFNTERDLLLNTMKTYKKEIEAKDQELAEMLDIVKDHKDAVDMYKTENHKFIEQDKQQKQEIARLQIDADANEKYIRELEELTSDE